MAPVTRIICLSAIAIAAAAIPATAHAPGSHPGGGAVPTPPPSSGPTCTAGA